LFKTITVYIALFSPWMKFPLSVSVAVIEAAGITAVVSLPVIVGAPTAATLTSFARTVLLV
jgi:hypothetical protein